jgi:hypothetical protein
MFVNINTNLGTNDYPETSFLEGEVHEVSDDLGRKLVARKHASEVVPPQSAQKPKVAEVEEPKPAPKAVELTAKPSKSNK